MVDSIKVIGESLSLPIFAKALMSLAKQLPQYPGPQCKNLGDILPSLPIALVIT